MKVIAIKSFAYSGTLVKPGDKLDVPDNSAWVALGLVKPAGKSKKPPASETPAD